MKQKKILQAIASTLLLSSPYTYSASNIEAWNECLKLQEEKGRAWGFADGCNLTKQFYKVYYAYEFTSQRNGTYHSSPITEPAEPSNIEDISKNAGRTNPNCSFVGNPVNLVNGNKFQEEIDITSNSKIGFSRFYNSTTGLWTHSFSRKLNTKNSTITLTKDDGSKVTFVKSNDSWLEKTGNGKLVYEGVQFTHFQRAGEKDYFDGNGYLVKIARPSGNISIKRITNNKLVITHESGETLSLTLDALRQPLFVSSAEADITYLYNSYQRLVSANKKTQNHTATRLYHYEDVRNPKLLTGLTDERGTRYATWSYDDQGRAISSEHANGTEKIALSYNTDSSTTVTNELGMQTIYRYQIIQHVRRITAIEGEPSANCPASDSRYTYNDHGLLRTKIDNKGNVTTYEYNDNGLVVSRTEAFGTPEARTITTAWHPTMLLPVTVTEPTKIIRYSYDAHGRLLSSTIMER